MFPAIEFQLISETRQIFINKILNLFIIYDYLSINTVKVINKLTIKYSTSNF